MQPPRDARPFAAVGPHAVPSWAVWLVCAGLSAAPANAGALGNKREAQAGRVRLTLGVGTGYLGGSLDAAKSGATSPGGRYPVFLDVDPQIELGGHVALALRSRAGLEQGNPVELLPGFVYHLWWDDFAVLLRAGASVNVNPFLGGMHEGTGVAYAFSDHWGASLELGSTQFFGGKDLHGSLWTITAGVGVRGAF